MEGLSYVGAQGSRWRGGFRRSSGPCRSLKARIVEPPSRAARRLRLPLCRYQRGGPDAGAPPPSWAIRVILRVSQPRAAELHSPLVSARRETPPHQPTTQVALPRKNRMNGVFCCLGRCAEVSFSHQAKENRMLGVLLSHKDVRAIREKDRDLPMPKETVCVSRFIRTG